MIMAEREAKNVLSIRGMCKSFGRNRVLDHIDLDVKEGSIMGLMGENGAGKSTMMKCLFGTYQKDEGTIFLNGKEVNFSGPKMALENGIANTLFYAGDMKDILTDAFIMEHGRPDVLITDPPRAGMHPDVVQTILRAHPRRIVYADYRVEAVQPVDMFPHTPHVENVVLLTARESL